MPEDLKERVLEIVSIVKECPENLQSLCFELLLRDYLERRHQRRGAPPTEQRQQPPTQSPAAAEHSADEEGLVAGETATGQQDLKTGDLHMKARKFMERYAITLDHLNQLFYKEGGRSSRCTRT